MEKTSLASTKMYKIDIEKYKNALETRGKTQDGDVRLKVREGL